MTFGTPITAFPLLYEHLIPFCNSTTNPSNVAQYPYLCSMIEHVVNDTDIDICVNGYKGSLDVEKLRTQCIDTLNHMFPKTTHYTEKALLSMHTLSTRYSDIGYHITRCLAIVRHYDSWDIPPKHKNTLLNYEGYPYEKSSQMDLADSFGEYPILLSFPDIYDVYLYMCEDKCVFGKNLTKVEISSEYILNTYCYTYEKKSKESIACIARYVESKYHSNVCLYANTLPESTDTTFNIKGMTAVPFVLTPNGLKSYANHTSEDKYRYFCKQIADEIDNHIIGDEFQGITAYVEDYDINIAVVSVLTPDSSVGFKRQIFTIKWDIHLDYSKYIKLKTVINVTSNTYEHNIQTHTIGIFTSNDRVLAAVSRLTYEDVGLYEKYISCPAKGLIYAVTSSYWEGVCHATRYYNTRLSVFNIGSQIYHQTGRYFYYFTYQSDRMKFDRHVTQLLATYFETRHRVTGYSVESRHMLGYYEVVIHGMSSPAYRSLGRYIYAMFTYSGNTFMGTQILTPVVDPTAHSPELNVIDFTLGPAKGDISFANDMHLLLFGGLFKGQTASDYYVGLYMVYNYNDTTIWVSDTHSKVFQQVYFVFNYKPKDVGEFGLNYAYNFDELTFDKLVGIYFDTYGTHTIPTGPYLVANAYKETNKDLLYIYNMYNKKEKKMKSLKDIEVESTYLYYFCGIGGVDGEAPSSGWHTSIVIKIICGQQSVVNEPKHQLCNYTEIMSAFGFQNHVFYQIYTKDNTSELWKVNEPGIEDMEYGNYTGIKIDKKYYNLSHDSTHLLHLLHNLFHLPFGTPITAYPLVYEELINFCNFTSNAANYTHLCAMITHVMRDHNIDLICIVATGDTKLLKDFTEPLVQNCLINYKLSADLQKLRTHCVNTLDQMFPTAQYVGKSLVSIQSLSSRYSETGNYISRSVAIFRHIHPNHLTKLINTLFYYKAYPYNKTISVDFVDIYGQKPILMAFPAGNRSLRLISADSAIVLIVSSVWDQMFTSNKTPDFGDILQKSWDFIAQNYCYRYKSGLSLEACISSYVKSKHYSNVCLYASTQPINQYITFSTKGLIAYPFILTPDGLKGYSYAESEVNYHRFCQIFADSVYKVMALRGLWHHHFQGITAYVDDYETNKAVVSVLTPDSNRQHIYTIAWDLRIKYEKHMNFTSLINVTAFDYIQENQTNITALFTHYDRVMAIVSKSIHKQPYIYAINNTSSDEPLFKPVDNYLWHELITCPANGLIYSVTSNYWEDVCPLKRGYDSRQSVFNIGPDIYHQTGRHFYLFSYNDRVFEFDIHVTQLLAIYFETRHRVTGYSVESRHMMGYYEVIIHGMSSPAYRSLGRYIFAMFTYNANKFMGTPVLTPVADPTAHSPLLKIIDFTLGPAKGDISLANDMHPLLFAGLFWGPNPSDYYIGLYMVYGYNETTIWVSDTHHNVVKQIYFAFNYKQQNVGTFGPTYYHKWTDLKFDKLVGMYFGYGPDLNSPTGPYLVANWLKNDNKNMLYIYNMYNQNDRKMSHLPDIDVDYTYLHTFCRRGGVLRGSTSGWQSSNGIGYKRWHTMTPIIT
ncbi:unnamed protein product [Medioppia subpectinata]|uniref:Uncharacterized protein n=1 Tax=Medioppia subpectinata TaxID=1979941 RepID=A0A7R9PW92_9ACAR|nr:unnamed protein product [Medioppia subpectinata]CAG2103475.1 unnamed protein product [Medioppia subpectinata]